MTLAALPNRALVWPTFHYSSFMSFTANLLDGSTDKVCQAFFAPQTGSITGAGFNTGTVTTGDTLTVNLKSVDTTTGFAGGTTHATGTVAVADGDDNVHKDVTFAAGYSATAGQALCLEIVNGAVPGNLNIIGTGADDPSLLFPRQAHDTGAGYAFASRMLAAAINYNGTYYYIPSMHHFGSGTSVLTAWATATNDRQLAMKFKLPGPFAVCGLVWFANTLADLKVNLWDSNGATVLANTSIDENVLSDTTNVSYYAYFSSPVELDADTWYRISITPTAATSIGTYYVTTASSAKRGCHPGGLNVLASESNTHPPVEEADWDDTDTRVPSMSLIISSIDDGAGGAGGTRWRGLHGIEVGSV